MRQIKIMIFGLLMAAAGLSSAADEDIFSVSSGKNKVQLIELFTSEGCSSCPPADRWLSEYMENDGLWTRYVPMAFHVDYWDYIGWEDRFASKAFTQKQYSYNRSGATKRVYTPQFVVNGQEWRGWFKRIIPGLGGLPEQNAEVGELSLQVGQGNISASFKMDPLPQDAVILHVVLLASDINSKVTSGENEGRVLEHDFVVLSHKQYWPTGKDYSLHWLGRAPSTPAIAKEAGRLAWAAWVAPKVTGQPIQAVGGWIN